MNLFVKQVAHLLLLHLRMKMLHRLKRFASKVSQERPIYIIAYIQNRVKYVSRSEINQQ